MEMTFQRWKQGTEEFVPHHVMADYIADSAIDNDVNDSISFNTRVTDLRKEGSKWRISIDRLVEDSESVKVEQCTKVSEQESSHD